MIISPNFTNILNLPKLSVLRSKPMANGQRLTANNHIVKR